MTPPGTADLLRGTFPHPGSPPCPGSMLLREGVCDSVPEFCHRARRQTDQAASEQRCGSLVALSGLGRLQRSDGLGLILRHI